MTNANETRINLLAESIEGDAVPMAVVDYIGGRISDWKGKKASRMVDENTPAQFRYGTRSLRDCIVYDIKPLRLNKAARDRAAK